MIIETKHHVNKEVWLMRENRATKCSIWSCEPVVFDNRDHGIVITIRYRLEDHGKYYLDSDLFETKEALLQSL